METAAMETAAMEAAAMSASCMCAPSMSASSMSSSPASSMSASGKDGLGNEQQKSAGRRDRPNQPIPPDHVAPLQNRTSSPEAASTWTCTRRRSS
jgi:hypothetical protein